MACVWRLTRLALCLLAGFGPGFGAFAKHAYFSQVCRGTHGDVELETEQPYAGPYLWISANGKRSVPAEYFPREEQTQPVDASTLLGLRVLSLTDGPESIRSEDGYTSRTWKRGELAVVAFVSPSLGEGLGVELRMGDRLSLECLVTVLEPGETK